MSTHLVTIVVAVALLGSSPGQPAAAPEIAESPTLGAPPPAGEGTVVLFDGSEWTGWRQRDGAPSQWAVQPDGSVLVNKGDAITERHFRDFQLHLEFFCPEMPGRTGQSRSNSGVYLHGRYEVQVLNSHGDPPLPDGCGAIYGVAPPLINASTPPGRWQTYDIVFRAPRLDEQGELREPARITVLQNGLVIQNNVIVPGSTRASLASSIVPEGPILLQDHGDPVRYRNIWLREL
ncbi:MAG: 3-keto-disaccharide hydrolase [Planctomycetota bacterium]|jgi:hypothetical protein